MDIEFHYYITHLIAARAGALVTDRHGAGISFNRPHPQAEGVVCAAPAVHPGLIGRLGG